MIFKETTKYKDVADKYTCELYYKIRLNTGTVLKLSHTR